MFNTNTNAYTKTNTNSPRLNRAPAFFPPINLTENTRSSEFGIFTCFARVDSKKQKKAASENRIFKTSHTNLLSINY